MNGKIFTAPELSAWWLPYDRNAIMRYGNTVNSSIPTDPDEAEFPEEPWPTDVLIRIKSSPPPPALSPSVFVNSAPIASPPPANWQGPALGQAPLISAAAAGLSDYSSPNSVQTVDGQEDVPREENLQEFRGLSKKDELIHAIISWSTLESYPLRVGISLPVQNPANQEFHEIQFLGRN
jgi:hypothetical protein